MTDLARLPAGILLKVAQLEQAATGLADKLEASRRELQRLRVERRDTFPNEAFDQAGINIESERVLNLWRTQEEAIAAQILVCEEQEQRLATESKIIADCKSFLRELPPDAKIREIAAKPGNLAAIRSRIRQIGNDIAVTQRLQVPALNLAEKVAEHVAALAAMARPLISGVQDGQPLRVSYPLQPHADRNTRIGFGEDQCNPLLMEAALRPDALTEWLLDNALDGTVSAQERDISLKALNDELAELRFREEASVVATKAARSSSSPPWAVLGIMIEQKKVALQG